jgi:serine/threonine protein kinase
MLDRLPREVLAAVVLELADPHDVRWLLSTCRALRGQAEAAWAVCYRRDYDDSIGVSTTREEERVGSSKPPWRSFRQAYAIAFSIMRCQRDPAPSEGDEPPRDLSGAGSASSARSPGPHNTPLPVSGSHSRAERASLRSEAVGTSFPQPEWPRPHKTQCTNCHRSAVWTFGRSCSSCSWCGERCFAGGRADASWVCADWGKQLLRAARFGFTACLRRCFDRGLYFPALEVSGTIDDFSLGYTEGALAMLSSPLVEAVKAERPAAVKCILAHGHMWSPGGQLAPRRRGTGPLIAPWSMCWKGLLAAEVSSPTEFSECPLAIIDFVFGHAQKLFGSMRAFDSREEGRDYMGAEGSIVEGDVSFEDAWLGGHLHDALRLPRTPAVASQAKLASEASKNNAPLLFLIAFFAGTQDLAAQRDTLIRVLRAGCLSRVVAGLRHAANGPGERALVEEVLRTVAMAFAAERSDVQRLALLHDCEIAIPRADVADGTAITASNVCARLVDACPGCSAEGGVGGDHVVLASNDAGQQRVQLSPDSFAAALSVSSDEALLGTGAFSEVFAATLEGLEAHDVALKAINDRFSAAIYDEIAASRVAFHPNVIQCVGVVHMLVRDADPWPRYCLVLERMDISLKDVLVAANGRPLSAVEPSFRPLQILQGVAYALHYLHTAHHVVHNDVQAANVLLRRSGQQVKLGDLGRAQLPRELRYRECERNFMPVGGFIPYCAPELLQSAVVGGRLRDQTRMAYIQLPSEVVVSGYSVHLGAPSSSSPTHDVSHLSTGAEAERASIGEPSPASDCWSLGVLSWSLHTGIDPSHVAGDSRSMAELAEGIAGLTIAFEFAAKGPVASCPWPLRPSVQGLLTTCLSCTPSLRPALGVVAQQLSLHAVLEDAPSG